MPHLHDKIDFTVEVFIVYKNKVLLRQHDKYKIWLSVGGHIEFDEDPTEAAIREVKEEVGLDIQLIGQTPEFKQENYMELIPPVGLNRHLITDTHEHVTLVYFAKAESDQLILSQKEKSDDCRWFTVEELDSHQFDIRDSVKYFAKKALQTQA